jgi:hypothetical protein
MLLEVLQARRRQPAGVAVECKLHRCDLVQMLNPDLAAKARSEFPPASRRRDHHPQAADLIIGTRIEHGHGCCTPTVTSSRCGCTSGCK